MSQQLFAGTSFRAAELRGYCYIPYCLGLTVTVKLREATMKNEIEASTGPKLVLKTRKDYEASIPNVIVVQSSLKRC
jgi:hypothetical protein